MSIMSFEIDCSAEVQAILDWQHLSLEADALALDALAQRVGVRLPEAPRLLLLNQGQIPHTPEVIIVAPRRSYLPTQRDENDILINVRSAEFNEPALTASIAQALAKGRRQIRNHQGTRVGAVLFAAGAIGSGVGEVALHVPAVAYAGYAVAAAGLSVATYYANRESTPQLDVRNLDAPIRMVPSAPAGQPGDAVWQ